MKPDERPRVLGVEQLPAYGGCVVVQMPPDWRFAPPESYSFVFTERELSLDEYSSYYRAFATVGLSNPRVLTPAALEMASLFHPMFWSALRRDAGQSNRAFFLPHAILVAPSSTPVATPRYYLQSALFLAGVTLSAAVVQNRWSRGTIESKFTRLWLAGAMASSGRLPELEELGLQEFVASRVPCLAAPNHQLLMDLKQAFSTALKSITRELAGGAVVLSQSNLTSDMAQRFGFIDDLREILGRNLIAAIAYGSSVTSDTFADYDVLVVVRNERAALERLAGSNPTYRGTELNLGVYDESSFWQWQLASGDNLSLQGLCLYGEIEVPEKSIGDLLARNFSFGFIRLRQILGMAAFASVTSLHDQDDDKRNLYGYFLKIPANIVKGTRGASGLCVEKTAIQRWIRDRMGYAVEPLMEKCAQGAAGDALSAAAWCTQRVLEELNREHPTFRSAPRMEVIR